MPLERPLLLLPPPPSRDLVRTRVETGFEVEEMLEGAKDAIWIGDWRHRAARCPRCLVWCVLAAEGCWRAPQPAPPPTLLAALMSAPPAARPTPLGLPAVHKLMAEEDWESLRGMMGGEPPCRHELAPRASEPLRRECLACR